MKINWTRKLIYMNPRDIIIDERYQRSAKLTHVERIADNWDAIQAKQLLVSKRADGKYYCVDGGHRLRGSIQAGVNRVDCIVYEGLTDAQEHQLFEGQDLSVRLTKLDIFKSKLDGNNEHAVKISELLKRHGLRVTYGHGSDGCFVALDALERTIGRWGWDVTDETFAIIKNTWGFDDYTTRGTFVKGLADIYGKTKGSRDFETFLARVARYDSKTIRQKANGYASQGLCGIRGITAALMELANKKAKHRLVFDND